MPTAKWNGVVIAESSKYETVEGNTYFPPESLKKEYFKPSTHTTVCSWKGTASYYDVSVNGKTNANAAWYYPSPSEAAKKIKGYIGFWKGVEVTK